MHLEIMTTARQAHGSEGGLCGRQCRWFKSSLEVVFIIIIIISQSVSQEDAASHEPRTSNLEPPSRRSSYAWWMHAKKCLRAPSALVGPEREPTRRQASSRRPSRMPLTTRVIGTGPGWSGTTRTPEVIPISIPHRPWHRTRASKMNHLVVFEIDNVDSAKRA